MVHVSAPSCRHRFITDFAAQSKSATAADIPRRILEAVPKDEKLNYRCAV